MKGKSHLRKLVMRGRTRSQNGITLPKPVRLGFSLNKYHPATKTFTVTRKTMSVKHSSKKKCGKCTYKVQMDSSLKTPTKSPSSLKNESATNTPSSFASIDTETLLNYPLPWEKPGKTPVKMSNDPKYAGKNLTQE